jgi:hypothetical protein
MKRILAGLVLAFCLAVVPACAQTAPAPEQKIAVRVVVIGTPDKAATTFLNTVHDAMKNMDVLPKAADTNDATTPEMRVMIIGDDTKETVITVAVLFHIQGTYEPVYLGMMSGAVTEANAADDAKDMLSKVADAFDAYIDELESVPAPPKAAPNKQKQRDHEVKADTYSHA